jgi:uncharacterized cupredoxin-like copper-binding protein
MLKHTSIITALGVLLTATAAILATHIAMPRPASAHEDRGHFSAGEPGDPKKPARVVEIKMFEGSGKMGYEPARIEVRRGEQIRFVLQNDGEEDHEFILATVAENRKHAEVMKKNPDMEHDDPNAKRLLPHGHSEIVWKFTKRGTFEFACLIPGHYEKGMVGRITVK